MRYFFLICATILLGACCSNSYNQFVIDGRINGAEEGEMVCLSYPIKQGEIWKWQRDTTYIQKGHFSFSGYIDDFRPASLTFQNMDYANIYIEPTKISFYSERNALYNYTLRGLTIDNELIEYNATFGDLERKLWEHHHLIQHKNIEWMATNTDNATDYERLLKEFYILIDQHRTMRDNWASLAIEFTQSHPNYTITPAILEQLIAQGYNISSENNFGGTLGELLTLRRRISESYQAEVGSKALDFTLTTSDSKEIKLSECYANGCVLLDFWASWCSPCIAEISKLKSVHSKYKDKLQVLSISIDEDTAQWHNAIKQHNLTEWEQLIINRPADADSYYFREQSDLSIAYNVTQIPCYILIDRQGVVIGRWSHLTEDVEEVVLENI